MGRQQVDGSQKHQPVQKSCLPSEKVHRPDILQMGNNVTTSLAVSYAMQGRLTSSAPTCLDPLKAHIAHDRHRNGWDWQIIPH